MLLSADPVVGAVVQAVVVDDRDHDQQIHAAYDFDHPGTPEPLLTRAQAHYALVEQPRLVAPVTFSVDRDVFDLGVISRQGYYDSTLTVAANEELHGSGALNVSLLNAGVVSPGYSPGVQNVASYTQGAGATLEIELGGNTAGTGTGHYDQLNVANTASLDGLLSVKLIDGFKPADGEVFTFLTFGAISGSFASGTGLLAADEGLYFELKQNANTLQLVAHHLDETTAFMVDTLGSTVAGGLGDRMGEWLNYDYFGNNQTVSFAGDIDLGNGLNLSGNFSLGYTANVALDHDGVSGLYDVWRLGLVDGQGYLGLDATNISSPGLRFSDADIGALFISATDGSDLGWVLATGQASGFSLNGMPGMTLSAQQLTLDFAVGLGTHADGSANDGGFDLSAHPLAVTDTNGTALFTFDDAATTKDHVALSGTATLVIMNDITIAGDIGLSASDTLLYAAGQNVSAHLDAGGISVGIAQGSFGLVIGATGLITLEAQGSAHLVGGDFGSVSAQSALLRFNQSTSAFTGTVLSFGSFDYTFGDMPASASATVNVQGLNAVVSNSFVVSGDFAFGRDAVTGAMQIVASHAYVALRSGSFDVGVSNASVGLLVQDTGPHAGTILEASGGINVNLGGQVELAGTVASVRWNSTLDNASGQAIDVAGATHTFGAGLTAGLQEVAVTGGLLEVAGFFSATGDFALHKSVGSVFLADNAATQADESANAISVDLLTLGARDVSATAGLAGTALGLQLSGVEFALALMSARNDATRSWTSLQASAGSVALSGVDNVTATGSQFGVTINRANKAGDTVVDLARAPVEVATGATTHVDLDMAGSQGDLVHAQGTLNLDLFGFVQATGSFAIDKRTDTVTLAGNAGAVTVDVLTFGATQASAFAGVNGGKTGAVGVSLTGVDFGLALLADQADASRTWTSVQAKAHGVTFAGITGLTLAASELDVAINQANKAGDAVVDYLAQGLAIDTGTSVIQFDMAGAKGELLQASGALHVDAFGFFQVDGAFAIQKSSQSVTLADNSTVTVDLLTLGASNVNAFAGVNGGAPGATGLNLTGVEFGLALASQHMAAGSTTPARTWTTLQASAQSAAFVGVDGLTLSAGSINVAINQASAANDDVIDYAAGKTALSVVTGTGRTLDLSLDGAKGDLLQASGNLSLDVFGFFKVDGGFAIEKSSKTVTLSDNNSVDVNLLTIGASGVSAFAGLNGGTTSKLGLELTGVEFGLALMSQKMATGATTPARTWTSLQAHADSASFVGVDGLTLTADSIDVNVNQASAANDAVVDYSTGKTELVVATGPSNTLALSMEGSKGKLIQAAGNLHIDVFGFFKVDGGFAIEKSSKTITLSDNSSVDVNLLTIGASGVSAFAGLNGNTTSKLGLELTGVEFGLALMSQKMATGATTPARTWTSLQAHADSASFVGMDGLTLTADSIDVNVNQASAANDAVVDYSTGKTELVVATGPSNTLALSMEGSKGELIQAAGNLHIDVFGFFKVDGGFAIEKSSKTITLSDNSSVDVNLLTIGASGVSAFAGLNGNTTSKLGLELTGVEFGLALMSQKMATGGTTPARTWTSLQAHADSASFVGVDGLTLTADSIDVNVNQASAANDAVVDYSTGKTELVVATGPSNTLALSMEGSRGELIQAAGNLHIDVFGFFKVDGAFAIEKSSKTITLSDNSSVDVNLLTIGASGVSAFAGLNGNTTSKLGLELTGVEFGLALMSQKMATGATTPARTWTSLQAHADSASFVGVDGLTLTADSIDVNVNQASQLNDAVVDYSTGKTDLVVATGPSDTLALSMEGSKGELIQAAGNLHIDVFGFFKVDGAFAIEKSSKTITLSDNSSVDVNLLTIGASGVSAFAGLNGNTTSKLGLELTGVEFGLALMSQKMASGATTPARTWTSLQAHADSASFIGVDGMTLTADSIDVNVNQASQLNDAVVDYSTGKTELVVATGPSNTLALSMEGSKGELIQAAGNLHIDVFGFFKVDGAFAIEKSSKTVTLSDNSSVDVNLLTIGASGVSAFAGLNGNTTSKLGLELTGVEFGLALMSQKMATGATTPARSWTSLQAHADSASFVGVDGLTLTADLIDVNVNQASQLNDAVVDYSTGKTDLVVATGPSNTLALSMEGSKGELIQAAGNLHIDVFGFFKVDGAFAIEKSSKTVTLSDNSSVDVNLLTIGASGVSAFAGLNGNTTSSKLGLELTGVEFGLALMSQKMASGATTPARTWTSLQAHADSASFVGVDGLTLTADSIDVNVNQASLLNDAVVDYSTGKTDLVVATGPSNTLALSMEGSKGELIQAAGNLHIDVFGFFKVDGAFAIEKSSKTVTLSDNSSVDVNLLTIGASGVSAFAGLNGNTTSKLGLELTGVEFGLALMSQKMATGATTPARTWTSLQAHADSASFVGVDGLTLTADSIDVNVNQASQLNDAVVDYSTGKTDLVVATGPSNTLALSMEGSKGELIQAAGNLHIDVFGFFKVDGAFAIEKSSKTVTLSDNSSVNVNLLTIGASGVSAFAGLNGNTTSKLGLELTGVEFGLALMSQKMASGATTPARTWTSLQAHADSASFIGVDGLTLTADSIDVNVNQASQLNDAVVDYSAGKTDLVIATGPSNTLALSMEGSKGELIQAAGNLHIDVFGFFKVDGAFAIEKSSKTVTLSDNSSVDVNLLTIGASGVSAFAGLNGNTTSKLGLELTGVKFGLALMSQKMATGATTPARTWTSLQAHADSASFIGVDGLTLTADSIDVNVNQASQLNDAVVDYSAGKTELVVATGPSNTLALSMEGSKGELIQAAGNLHIDVFGFFKVDGAFAIEKSSKTITLSDNSSVEVNLLTIGANGVSAFAGLNGNTTSKLGLELAGVEFGLALMSQKMANGATTPARTWTSLQAHADNASFIGVDGLTLTADSIDVNVNQASKLNDAVVDYSTGKTDLVVATGPSDTLALSMEGSKGELIQAAGNLHIDVFGFFKVDGAFAIEKSSKTVTLSDNTTVDVNLLTIGASNVSAFAGLNGGTTSALGLQLTGVDFGLALMSQKMATGATTPARTWTSLQAHADSASFVGVDGLTLTADSIDVNVNQASQLNDAVVDYSAGKTELVVATGPSNTLALSMEGSKGELIQAAGNLHIDVFGFFKVDGAFAIEKSSKTVTLSDNSSVDVNLLTIGASGVSAFAGLNGNTTSKLGLELTGVEFGLALMSQKMATGSTTPARTWTSLQAHADSASFVGVDGLTLTADSIDVNVNQASQLNDAVVDYSTGKTDLVVATGPSNTLALSMEGSKGELIQAAGNLHIDVFGFFKVDGGFAIEKSSKTVTLSDDSTVDVNLLTIGASNVSAFAGLNGGTTSALGLQLTGVEFGLALMSQKMATGATTPARTWTSLQAHADNASFIGVDGLTLTADSIDVNVNQASKLNDAVVDYSTGKTDLVVATGPSDTLALSMNGAKGELIQAAGNLHIDVFGFFKVDGAFAIEKSSKTVTLSDNSTVDVNLLTIGASNVSAFAGLNGGTSDAMGLQLTGVEFGLALMSQKMASGATTPARSWTTLQAEAASVTVVGMGDIELAADTLTVSVNQASKVNDAVVDYAAGKTDLIVATGPSNTLALSIDGAKGEMIQAAGHLTLDVYGFFQVDGNFAIEKSSSSVTLADKSVVDVNLLTIGASHVNAFAGLNGGTTGAIGLQLTDVDFGLAMMTQKSATATPTGRSWTTLQATAADVRFVGLGDDLTLSADTMSVVVNQAGKAGDQVVDYAAGATSLEVATGPTSTIALAANGAKGELVQATGNLNLDVFGFFQVGGEFAIEASTKQVTLSDRSTVDVDLLTIGASHVNAFAGLNGGTANRMGLALGDVEFGLALMSEQLPLNSTATARSWTSLQATAGSAAIVGAGDLVIQASNISVAINQASTLNGAVVDYAANATDLEIATGITDTITLDMKGAAGEQLQAAAHIVVDLYGFVAVEGDFAIQTRTADVILADLASTPDVNEAANPVSVDLLTLGASNVHAFAGLGGNTSDPLGLELNGVNFAIALMTNQADATQKWTSVKADAASVEFVGISAITMAATDIDVVMNRASLPAQAVVDFAASHLDVVVGTNGEKVTFDIDGARGQTTAVKIGRATLAISDYVYVSGGFYFEQTASVLVDVVTGLPSNDALLSPSVRAGLARVNGVSADNSRIEDLAVSALVLSATDVEVFAGLGPYFIDSNGNGIRDIGEARNADAFGVLLENIDLGLVMFDSTLAADPLSIIPKFFALQVKWAHPVDIDLGGVFKFDVTGLTIDVNQGSNWGGVAANGAPFVDFASSFAGGYAVPTGNGSSIVLDYDRSKIAVSLDHALLNIGDFFQIEGSFAFERTTLQVDVDTGLSGTLPLGAAALATDLARFKQLGVLSNDNAHFNDLKVDTITIGASDVTITVGDPSSPLFAIRDIDVAFAMMRASKTIDTNGVIPLMYAMKAYWPAPLDLDWGFMKLQVQDLELQLNKGSQWRGLTVAPTVDFKSSFGADGLQVATGGTPISLTYEHSTFGVEVGHALISIGDFFYVEGGFSIAKGTNVAVDIKTGFGDNDLQAAAALSKFGKLPGTYSTIDNYAMSMITLGLSDVKLFVGAGPYFVDANNDGVIDAQRNPDAVGLVVENLDLGLAMFTDPTAKIGRMWALAATADQIAFTGLDFLTLEALGAKVQANQGTVWAGTTVRPYVDFVSTFGAGGLSVATGNDPVALAYTASYIGVDVARATISIEKFVHIQGAFSFEKGRREKFDIDTGLSIGNLEMAPTLLQLAATGKLSSDGTRMDDVELELMTIGMNDVDVFVGYGTPNFASTTPIRDQEGVFGLAVSDIDLALAIMTPTGSLAKVLPKFMAMKGSASEFLVAGGADIFELSSGAIDVQMNWSAGWKGAPKLHASVDFASSMPGGLQVTTGGTTTALDFGPGAFVQAEVHDALLSVSEFVHFSGDFAFRMGTETNLTVKGPLGTSFTGVRANAIEFGANNVQAFVGINGPYRVDTNGDGRIDALDPINDEAMGLVIDDFDLGMTILTTQFDALNPLIPANTKFVGLKGHGEQVGFVGFGTDFIQFSLQDVNVGVNSSSRAGLIADFTNGGTTAGYTIATGGDPIVLGFDNAVMEASVAKATASIANILSLQGGFTFQKRTIDNVTFALPGTSLKTSAEALIVAGKDIYAFAGINGPYREDTNGDGKIDASDTANDDAIGLAIDDLDFALAMMAPSVAPGTTLPGKFFGLTASAAMAGLVGTDPFLTLNATDLKFDFNGAILGNVPVPGAYVDFSQLQGGGLDIPIGSAGDAMRIDFNSNSLRIGMDAHLGIFDLIEIDAGFDFSFELPSTGGLFPSINLSGIGDMLPTLSPDFSFLQGALDFVKNLDLSIGFDPNLGLTLFGSLDLPDLSLNLGDFVHLRGDFQLNIGESFTGSMYTGLPKEISLLTSLLGDRTQTILNMLTSVGGLSSDYSHLSNVSFKGLSFGAKDVYAFVGVGTPDYVAVAGQPGKLQITNADDLFGFGVEGVDVGLSMFKAQLPDFFQAKDFFSFYAHADTVRTYGMGDVLKIQATDVTIELNTGGELFGGLMRSTADFSESFKADPANGRPAGFEVKTGGTPVYLNMKGNSLMGLDIGHAEIQVSEFLYLSGSLAFRKGDRANVDVNLGGLQTLLDQTAGVGSRLNLEVEMLTLGGSNLTGFAGVGGPYRYGADANGDGLGDLINEGAIGLVIDDVDFGMAIATPGLLAIPQLAAVAPKFLAVKAHVGQAGLVGVDDDIMSVTARNIDVNINTFYLPSGGALNAALQLFGPPSIDWASSFPNSPEDLNGNKVLDAGEDRDLNGVLATKGYALPAGGNNAVIIDFAEEIVQAKVGYAEINIGGFVQLSASMAFTKRGAERVTLSNGQETTVTSLAVGINDAYGFVGVGGYWRDTNNNDRIDEGDTPNSSAVGLAVQNLDLGLVLAKELVIGTTGVDIGVYVAGMASIDKIGLVGVDGAEVDAQNLKIEINTGARVTLHAGQTTHDAETGAVSIASGVNVTFALTTIDFSQSTHTTPSGAVVSGYAIETGNPDEPVVLTYNEQLLRVFGEAQVKLFGLVSMTGVLDFRVSESEGLTAFADVNVRIGPDALNLSRHATGLLVIRGGAEPGVAMRLAMDSNLSIGSVVQLQADLDLSLNTFGKDIVYVVPEQFLDKVDFTEFTIGAAPPGKPGWVGPYAAVTGNGNLSLLDGALNLKGDFSVIVSYSNGAVRAELGATAVLDLPLFEPLSVTGTLGIVADGSASGVYGAFEVGGSGPDSKLIDGGVFNVAGSFLLQLNTTSAKQEVRTLALDAAGQPVGTVLLDAHLLRLSGNATISVGPVELKGAVDLLIDKQGVQAAMDLSLDLGGFGEVQVGGAAAFLMDANEGPIFAMRVATHVGLSAGVLGIGADAVIEINTGSRDYTTLHGDVIKGDTMFNMQLDGTIQLLSFKVQFDGGISIVDDVFKLEFNGHLNFFNALTVDVGGYADSEGNFEIRGKAEIDIRLGPLHLNAGMSLTLSSQPRFAAAAWGSLDFEIDLGLFSIDFTLAGFRAEIDINAGSAYMAARVTVMGITVSGSFKWSWADPPQIAYQLGDTLYLNMGDNAGRYGDSVYNDIVHESYSIEQEKDSNVVTVSSLGETASFTGVKHIVGRGGSGNDSVYVGRYVTAQLDLDGGEGNDSFVILGGGAGSVVRGGAGKDEFLSGDTSGIRFEGGAGDDRFVGGDGADIIDMGEGVNTIKSGGGNDVIYIGAGTNTVESGNGDDLIYVTGSGTLNLKGGFGNDRLVLGAFASTSPLLMGDHQLRTTINGAERIINFDDTLDRLEVTDTNATRTVLKMGSGASWGHTDFSLYSAGIVDVTQATLLKAPDALLSINAAGIDGTLTTQVAQLNVVNRGTAGAAYSNIVVREADSLSVITDGYAAGGLTTPNGLIDVQLATREAILSLDQGAITTGLGGGNISIVADDVDFRSGYDKVSGTGQLTLRAWSLDQSYRVGGAAQGIYGGDYSPGLDSGFFEFSMSDLSALKDGFSAIRLGHTAAGVRMYVGDVEDAQVGETMYSALLRDNATLLADHITVVGDVQSSEVLTFQGRLMEIQRQNVRTPMGAPDSGIHARQTVLRLTEQLVVTGWLRGDDLVDVAVTGTTGVGALVGYGAEPNSITGDKGAAIETVKAGGHVMMTGSKSVILAAGVYAEGADAQISIGAGTSLKLLEGGMVSAEGDRSLITLASTGSIGLLSGSAVLSGARFVTGQQTPVLTGTGAGVVIQTTGELMLAGSLTAGGAMRIDAGAVSDPHADYFDNLPGKQLASTTQAASFAAIISALNQNQIHVDLRALFGADNTPLANVTSVTSLANYTPFESLSDAAKATLVASLHYTTHEHGGYYNAATNTFGTTLTEGELIAYRNADIVWGAAGTPAANASFDQLTKVQQQVVATTLGYTMFDGLVFTHTTASGTMTVATAFTQGPSYDYDNAAIGWAAAGVAVPAAGTAFAALSGAQKMLVAEALGYTFDYYSMPGDLWFGTGVDATPVATIPGADAAWSQLTAEQRAIVAEFIDHGEGYKNFFNYNAAPGKKSVADFTQGPSSDYRNADIYWGSAGAPAANASFADLTAAQQKVVARSLGYEVLEGVNFIKVDAAAPCAWWTALPKARQATTTWMRSIGAACKRRPPALPSKT
ncbi:hypothetical protein [Pigmentiphaga litoralis]|uniref:hypothetical protein n=1 Tax=Pigmentiphaga litoralis TaxID=516702 RepID=UPI003B43563D